MRRLAALFAAVLTLALLVPAAVQAQDATPDAGESALAASGLPELRIRITDTAYEAASTDVAAGLTLLVVENTTQEDQSATIGRPAAGTTIADVMATPPAAEEELPAWIFDATILGGPFVNPGETEYAVVNLTAGEWGVFGEGDQAPAVFTVTGEAPADAVEPAADVEIQLQDFAFVGLPETLTPGRKVWKITNNGPQHHFVDVSAVPAGTTMDQVMEVFAFFMTGTPTAGTEELANAELPTAGGMEVQSAGQTTWVEIDLAPGTYLVGCYWPDAESGMPHAFMGMAAILTVA